MEIPKFILIHEKAVVPNLVRIKELAIEIYGELTFELKDSPGSGDGNNKYVALHMEPFR